MFKYALNAIISYKAPCASVSPSSAKGLNTSIADTVLEIFLVSSLQELPTKSLLGEIVCACASKNFPLSYQSVPPRYGKIASSAGINCNP